MNVLRKISIDTVLLALAVALCIAGLVWLGGAHAWIAALGVGVFVAAQEAPHATNPPRSCATCSRPLNAWQLRFDGGAELRCGRYDCAAKDKLVATRDADGTVREMVTASASDASPPELPAGSTLIGLDDNAGIFGATTVDVPALYDQIERQAAEIERLKAQRGLTSEEMAIIEQTRALVRERDELRASVDLLDEQGRRMKAERDEAKEAERWIRKQLDGVSTSLTKERDDARAEIERMKPVVEAARAAERHITELEDSSPINSGVLIDLRAALETLDVGAL